MSPTDFLDLPQQHGSGNEATLDPPDSEIINENNVSVASSETSSNHQDENPQTTATSSAHNQPSNANNRGRGIRGGRFRGQRGNGNDLATHFWKGRGRSITSRNLTLGDSTNEINQNIANSNARIQNSLSEAQFPPLVNHKSSAEQGQLQLQFGSFSPFTPTTANAQITSELIFGEKNTLTNTTNSSFNTMSINDNIREIMQPAEGAATRNIGNITLSQETT